MELISWIDVALWLGKCLFGLFVAGFVDFPLQVKYQAPDASMAEIYKVLWDCIVDLRESPPQKHEITRPEWEYRRGHIEGAILLPFNKFRDDFRCLPRNRPIVLTCHFGKYSVVAANKLTQAGYTKVYDYAKGMEEWNRLEKAVETGMPKDVLIGPTASEPRANSTTANTWNPEPAEGVLKKPV